MRLQCDRERWARHSDSGIFQGPQSSHFKVLASLWDCICYGSINWLLSLGHASLAKCMLIACMLVSDQFFQIGGWGDHQECAPLRRFVKEVASLAIRLKSNDRKDWRACKFVSNASRIKSKRTTESKRKGFQFARNSLGWQQGNQSPFLLITRQRHSITDAPIFSLFSYLKPNTKKNM